MTLEAFWAKEKVASHCTSRPFIPMKKVKWLGNISNRATLEPQFLSILGCLRRPYDRYTYIPVPP